MKKYIILLVFLSLISCYSNKLPVDPADPANKGTERFLLTEAEMRGFELIRQSPNHIVINDELELHEVIEQKWHIIGEDDHQNFHIYYCEFENSIKALHGIAYAATRSNQWPYIWGSHTGSIIKDGSWICAYSDDAINFIRGNIGIKIFRPLRFNEKDRQIMLDLCTKLQKKVEKNLAHEIIAFEQHIKEGQILYTDYQSLTRSVIYSEIMNDFSPHSEWDSKWLIDSTNMVMGIRQEWKDSKGSVVGIDICKFESENTAREASKLMSYNTWRSHRLFQLDDVDSLKQIIDIWEKYGIEKIITVVAYKNNIAYHIYYFDPMGIDTEFFYAVVEKLTK